LEEEVIESWQILVGKSWQKVEIREQIPAGFEGKRFWTSNLNRSFIVTLKFLVQTIGQLEKFRISMITRYLGAVIVILESIILVDLG
jgi:hypothetical protein